VPLALPRGRYEIEFFAAFLKLHGKTYDYKVMYSSMVSLYTLPKPDQYHINVAIHLDPSIRQGNTYYQFILMQFPVEEELSVEVALSEQVLRDKYKGRLEKSLRGPTHEVMANLVSGLTGKKVNQPAADFKSNAGYSAIRCALKADDGYLFAFEKAFLFVNKPTTLIPYDTISAAEFKRVDKATTGGAASKSFDMVVHKKSGESVTFSNIRRNEYSSLFNFLVARKLRIKNIHKGATGLDVEEALEPAEPDDLHMKKIKRDREAEDEEDDDDDDDSDDEDDEDFAAGDDSDVDEEYEEDGCSDDEEATMAKKKGGGKKQAKGSGSESESESDDEESGGGKKAKQKKTAKGKDTGASPKAKKAKKEKKAKDPNAPKKPLTAFFAYSAAMRPVIKEEQPELSVPEQGKALGERWKNETPEVRAKYEEEAANAKVKYEAALKAYEAEKKGELTHRDEDEDDEDDDDGPAGDIVDDDDD